MASLSILFIHVSSAIIQPHIILKINSTPPGATVTIDNKIYGKTPVDIIIVDLNLKRIALNLPGYVPREEVYNPKTGPDEINVSLRPISAPAT